MSEDCGPITFEELASGGVTAKLGIIIVATIRPWPGGGRVGCHYSFTLPDMPVKAFGATSVEAAKRQIEIRVRDWIGAAGLMPIAGELARGVA